MKVDVIKWLFQILIHIGTSTLIIHIGKHVKLF